ncbi:maleylpyruvate isomerase family mycothiol-dependent enzyme [Subtercola lobariae]|uniref:Maleylpyruvate isomerase n=1 Tax=Subtercola lobariae TaxID=1588641 RepID=A0A917BDC5_9MICO|nr:maleylpyruvate isomerase family mycothiol-dependent enzyme [Subtercola lobariae]GGF38228.1 maleylpyruvate isomerase [Subtercola lobariae]
MPGRTDNVTDPDLAARLLIARRGQAYYSRKLNELSDEEFNEPSRLAGWSRRELIAHVGLNARALTHLTEWAASGIEHPMYSSPTQRKDDIEFAATLPTQALRNLSDHAAIHLNVEWRDLPEEAWSATIRTAQGRIVPASETVWIRSREVWIHAVDLGNGANFLDFPAPFVDALLTDVTSAWARRREAESLPYYVLEPLDRPQSLRDTIAPPDAVVLRGPATGLAQWATGRGATGVEAADGSLVPSPPRWL